MKKHFLVFICLLCVSGNCDRKPSHIDEQQIDQFVSVYTDYIKIITTDSTNIAERKSRFDSLLNHHNLTQNDFKKIFSYFQSNPQKFDEVLAKINAQLQSLKNAR